jgi:hypothetical protein
MANLQINQESKTKKTTQEIEDSESGKITDKSHLFSDAILFIALLLSYCTIFDKTPIYPQFSLQELQTCTVPLTNMHGPQQTKRALSPLPPGQYSVSGDRSQ